MRILFFIISISVTQMAFCQKRSFDSLKGLFDTILSNPIQFQYYELDKDPTTKQLILKFDFGSNEFAKPELVSKSQGAQIKYVTYIYSSFKTVESFQQDDLNRKRLYTLYKQLEYPFVKDIEWEVIEQTKEGSINEVSNLFHGFVIHYREPDSKQIIEKELTVIKNKLNQSSRIITLDKPKRLYQPSTMSSPSTSLNDYHEIQKRRKAKQDNHIRPIDMSYGKLWKDTLVTTVLNRNQQWNKMLVISDLTASMSSYTSQLFVWFKLNSKLGKIKFFTFFNDGNRLADYRKEIGNTGGIYFSEAKSGIEEVLSVAEKCMQNRNGGDIQENDIEAILKGLQNYDDYSDVVLIADNWSKMRDYDLISEVKHPIHVILCGTSRGVNTQYLDLARTSSGSVHTLDQDCTNLSLMSEGEVLKIGSFTYQLTEGVFLEVD